MFLISSLLPYSRTVVLPSMSGVITDFDTNQRVKLRPKYK